MTISFIRTLILYCIVVLALRIMGKRQIGELSPSELVVTILASELASIPMQDFDLPLVTGIVPIFTLISLEILISFLCMKSVKFRKIISGNPCIIVREGKFERQKMFEMRLNVDEVMEELRINGVADVADVKYAIVETNGTLSVILKPSARAVTADDLDITIKKTGLPLTVINDGKIIHENLRKTEKTEAFLNQSLKNNNISKISEVFIMTIDDYDNIFIQRKSEFN